MICKIYTWGCPLQCTEDEVSVERTKGMSQIDTLIHKIHDIKDYRILSGDKYYKNSKNLEPTSAKSPRCLTRSNGWCLGGSHVASATLHSTCQ